MLIRKYTERGFKQALYDNEKEAVEDAIKTSKKVDCNVTVILTGKKEYMVESPMSLHPLYPGEKLIGVYHKGKKNS